MEARHAVGGCATCIVGPLMADVQASDGGEEDLQRERCWEVSFTERRMRCRLKAFRHLVPRLNVQPVRSYNVSGNTKSKKYSRSIKTTMKILSSWSFATLWKNLCFNLSMLMVLGGLLSLFSMGLKNHPSAVLSVIVHPNLSESKLSKWVVVQPFSLFLCSLCWLLGLSIQLLASSTKLAHRLFQGHFSTGRWL